MGWLRNSSDCHELASHAFPLTTLTLPAGRSDAILIAWSGVRLHNHKTRCNRISRAPWLPAFARPLCFESVHGLVTTMPTDQRAQKYWSLPLLSVQCAASTMRALSRDEAIFLPPCGKYKTKQTVRPLSTVSEHAAVSTFSWFVSML